MKKHLVIDMSFFTVSFSRFAPSRELYNISGVPETSEFAKPQGFYPRRSSNPCEGAYQKQGLQARPCRLWWPPFAKLVDTMHAKDQILGICNLSLRRQYSSLKGVIDNVLAGLYEFCGSSFRQNQEGASKFGSILGRSRGLLSNCPAAAGRAPNWTGLT